MADHADHPSAMQQRQASHNHIAAAGRAAARVPAGKRTAQDKKAIKTFTRTFGEAPKAGKNPFKGVK